MTHSKSFRNITVFALISIIFTMPLLAQAQENDQVLKLIPDNALGCIRINNLNKSATQMDQFISDIYPISISGLIKGQLPNLLGSPDLAGMNMNGDFAVFGAILSNQTAQSAGMADIFPGILVPVTNYQEFLNGISSKNDADANGITKIALFGNSLVTQVGSYALLTSPNSYDNLLQYKKLMGIGTSASAQVASLSNSLDSSEKQQAVSQPIWFYGNIEKTSSAFGPMLTGAIEGLKSSITNLPNANTGVSDTEIQNIMNMYVGMLDTLMKEVKSVSISINPTQDSLNITNVINAVPGSEMAKMFASNPDAKENTLLPYLEDGALMNFAFTLNSPLWTQSIDMQMNLISMLGGDKISKEDIEKLKSISKSMIDCVSGSAVYTFSGSSEAKFPFKGKYIIPIKDENKFKQLMNDSFKMISDTGFFDIYKNMGMDMNFTINENVETYKGISIDSAQLSIKFEDTNTPQAQMIDEMYADGFNYRWCVTNGLFASTIGNDSDKAIHELIDEIQSGQAKEIGSETKAALALIPWADKSDFFITMNFLRLFKMSTSMASSIAPLPIPNIDVQTKSNLVLAGKADNGKMTLQLAIPKEHIKEIMNAIGTIQQKMMTPAPAAQL